MSKPIKSKDIEIKIYCEDTDFQGFVYHANYLKYFERSRTEFLLDNNIQQNVLLQQEKAFVVRSIKMKYSSPAKIEDKVIIKSEIYKNSNARLTFSQKALDKTSSNILCTADVEICLINLTTKKPQIFNNDLLLLFS